MATQPTPIVDKNGKQTTVHKKIDTASPTRALPVPATRSTPEPAPTPYIPHDIYEMDRMIAAMPAEEDTSLPNSFIRIMGTIRNDTQRGMEAGYDFADAYKRARNTVYGSWLVNNKGAIDTFESLAD